MSEHKILSWTMEDGKRMYAQQYPETIVEENMNEAAPGSTSEPIQLINFDTPPAQKRQSLDNQSGESQIFGDGDKTVLAVGGHLKQTNPVNILDIKISNNPTVVHKNSQATPQLAFKRKFNLNDTISTPPSELRRQIRALMTELDEAHEFHDLELQVLKDEVIDHEVKDDDLLLGKSLSDAQNVILDLNKDISNLKSENLELKEQLHAKNFELEESKTDYERKLGDIKTELKKRNFKIEQLEKDKDDFEYRLELINEKTNKRLKELEDALAEARQYSSQQLAGDKTSESTINQLENKVQTLTREKTELSTNINSLTEQLQEEQKKLTKLEAVCLTLTLERDNSTTILDKINAEKESLRLDMITLKSNSDSQITQLESKMSELNSIVEECNSFKNLLEETKTGLLKLEAEKAYLEQLVEEKSNEALRLKYETERFASLLAQESSDLQVARKKLTDFENLKKDEENEPCENCMNLERTVECVKTVNDMLSIIEMDEAIERIKEEHKATLREVEEKSKSCLNAITEEKVLLNETVIKSNEELSKLTDAIKYKEAEMKELQEKHETKLAEAKCNYESVVEDLKRQKEEHNRAISEKNDELERLMRLNLSPSSDDTLKGGNNTSYFFKDNINIEGHAAEVTTISEAPTLGELTLTEDAESEDDVFCSARSDAPELVCKTESETSINQTQIEVEADVTLENACEHFQFEQEFVNVLLGNSIVSSEEIEGQNIYYLLLDKFLNLFELYRLCKQEYEEYRALKEEEYENKAMECVENIFSQLEGSDSSLNATGSSIEFSTSIRSSTMMMMEQSELEATMVGDQTLQTNDPLSLTVMQTPAKTPCNRVRAAMNSAKSNQLASAARREPLSNTLKTPSRAAKKLNLTSSAVKMTPRIVNEKENQWKEACMEKEKALVEVRNKLTPLEETLAKKIAYVEKLEQRIANLEDLSSVFDDERSRIRSEHEKQVKTLRESLSEKTEKLNSMREKLMFETISLNPSLENAINDATVYQLLTVFIDSIMESCKKVQNELWKEKESNRVLLDELACENSRMTEKIKLNEIQIFDYNNQVKDLRTTNLELNELLTKATMQVEHLTVKLSNAEKLKQELESVIEKLETEMGELKEVKCVNEQQQSGLELFRTENENLKTTISVSEQTIEVLKAEIDLAKQKQDSCETTVEELIREIELLKETLSEGNERNRALEAEIDNRTREEKARKGELDSLSLVLAESQSLLKEKDDLIVNLKKSKEETNLYIQDLNQYKDVMTNQMEVEMNGLKGQILKLEESIVNRKETIAELESLNNVLNENSGMLKNDVLEKEKTIEQLVNRIEMLSSDNDKLSSLSTELTLVEGKNKELSNVISELEAKLEVSKQSEEDKMIEIELANSKIIENEEAVSKLNAQIEILVRERSDTEKRNEEITALVAKLEEEVKDSKDANVKLTESEERLNGRIQKLLSDNDELNMLNSQLTVLEEKNQELQRLIEGLMETIKSSEEMEKLKVEEIERLNTKIAETEDRLKRNKAESEKVASELNEQIGKLAQDHEQLEIANVALSYAQDKNRALEEKISQLEESKEFKVSEIDKLNEELNRREEEKSELTAKIEEATRKMMDLSDTQSLKLKKTISDLEELVRVGKEAEELLNARLAESCETNVKLTEELNAGHEELELATARSKVFEERVALLEEKLKTSEESESRQTEEMNQMRTRLEVLVPLNKRLTELQEVNLELTEKLARLEVSRNEELDAIKNELAENGRESSERLGKLMEEHEEVLRSVRVEADELRKTVDTLDDQLKTIRRSKELESELLTMKLTAAEDKLKTEKEQMESIVVEKEGEIRKLMQEVKNQMEKVTSEKEEKNALAEKLKEVEVSKESAKEILMELQESFDLPRDTVVKLFSKTTTGNKHVFKDKINELRKFKMEEIEKLKKEIDSLNRAVADAEEKKQELETTCKSQLDELNNLRAVAITLQTEVGKKNRKSDFSHSFNSRRADRLEELNKLLSDTIYQIVKMTGFANYDHLNLCSVRNFETSNKQILDHIAKLSAQKNDSVSGEGAVIRHAPSPVLAADVANLRDNLLEIQKRVGLSETMIHSKETIANRITEMIRREIAKSEGLDEENRCLKAEAEKLKVDVTEAVSKLSDLERAKESQTEEIARLRIEISSLMTVNTRGDEKTKRARKSDLCGRRLDRLEELNQCLVELVTKIAEITQVPKAEKLSLFSIRTFDFNKQEILNHLTGLMESKTKEMEALKAQNEELDEECESYANTIKELKKQAVAVGKANLKEKEEYEARISGLEMEVERLNRELGKKTNLRKSSSVEESNVRCRCDALLKELEDVKQQRWCQVQELEAQCTTYKSEIKFLESSLDKFQKKLHEEKTKNEKSATKAVSMEGNIASGRTYQLSPETNQIRMRGTMSGGIVQEALDGERYRKLAKEHGILKEICRTRNDEIKKLKAENNTLRSGIPKNSNQMNSPIRTRCYNTRSKIINENSTSPWRRSSDKENQI